MQPSTSPRMTIFAFIIVAVMIAIGIGLVIVTRPTPVEITINPPQATRTPDATFTPGPITVYVSGAVVATQVSLSLPNGSRVDEAIQASGGALDNADLDRVNLAAVLRDGDQVFVPTQSVEAVITATPQGGIKVILNTATLEELMTLPGVGETTAQAILDFRAANGAFTSIDQLDEVDGIGASTLAEIRPFVVLD